MGGDFLLLLECRGGPLFMTSLLTLYVEFEQLFCVCNRVYYLVGNCTNVDL
jgi:hypothetical protein